MNPSTFPRILGGLTAAYGVYTLWHPSALLRTAGLMPGDLPPSQQQRGLARAIGARDLISGASMMVAPVGAPLHAAIVARVACELGDAVGFGFAVPRRFRAKVIAVAGGWGQLCAASYSAARRTSW